MNATVAIWNKQRWKQTGSDVTVLLADRESSRCYMSLYNPGSGMEPKMLRCMLDRDERQWPNHHLLLHYSLVWFSTQSAIITYYHHHLWLITVCLGTEWVHVCFSVKNSQQMPQWSTPGTDSRVQHIVVFLQTCFLCENHLVTYLPYNCYSCVRGH